MGEAHLILKALVVEARVGNPQKFASNDFADRLEPVITKSTSEGIRAVTVVSAASPVSRNRLLNSTRQPHMFPPSLLVQPPCTQQCAGMTTFRPINPAYDRELLQMEEQRLAAALSLVRRKLNNMLPISQLPPEIMEQIFHICVSWLYGLHKPAHRLAWTQVCYTWRFISLNSSKLWQRIDLADARLIEEFIVRSKMAPLSIVSSSPVEFTADNLAPHAHRVRCINVYLYPNDITHLFSVIGSNLSSLTSLSLKAPPPSPSSPTPLHLSVSLPCVRHLSLTGVSVKWEDYRDLTNLEICGLMPKSCPSVSQLHGIFSRSPDLENIRLVKLAPSRLETNPGSSESILLLNIKDMMLSSEQDVITAILRHVKLGPSSRLRLHTSELTHSLIDLFPEGLPQLTNPHTVIHITSLRVSRNGVHLSHHGTPTWSDEPLFSITSTETRTNVCDSLRHLIDLSSVTKLELNTTALMYIAKEDLDNLFANLHSLETLCTAFNDLEDLLKILQHSGHSAKSPLYVPRLINLSFSKPAVRWWHFADRWLSPIIECVLFRKLQSHPIQTVEFFRCHGLSVASTEQLRDIVPNVVISEQISSKSCV